MTIQLTYKPIYHELLVPSGYGMGLQYGYGYLDPFQENRSNGCGNGENFMNCGDGIGVDQRVAFDNGDGLSWGI